jgi:methionine sulfoxide reductase catalytic subunit
MRAADLAAAVSALSGLSQPAAAAVTSGGSPLVYRQASSRSDGFDTDEQKTPLADITSYGNIHEFGTDKGDPGRYAHEIVVDPWSLEVDGAMHKPGKLHLEDILTAIELQERIYRLRCVEAWSMVIPRVGFKLSDLLQ